MKRLAWLPRTALCALALAACSAMAQTTIDLGAIFNTGKNLVKSQTVGAMGTEDEVRVGKDIVGAMLVSYPLVPDPAFQQYLNQVGVWIALRSTRPELPWRFALVQSDSINAFAAPGGTVLVTQGMLKLVVNEAELACVLGHEIAHVSRRHHISVMQKSLLLEAGASAIQIQSDGRKSGSSMVPNSRSWALSEGKELFTRGLDRSAEQQADEDGVLLAARAGYDPAACLNFMQRLASLKAESGPLEALYKTHPPASERVADVDQTLRKLTGAAAGDGARPTMAALPTAQAPQGAPAAETKP
ncbi:MAG: peptidase [Rhodoferax sp.]|nr:MAG: peptidase [Rhodoferax sp.]